MKTQAGRLSGLGTTIFARMTALAQQNAAINLGQGFPDTDGPESVIQSAVAALRSGHNQYAPGPGIARLRTAIADHQRRFYGLDLDPESEIVVTTGATEAIAAALLGLVDPGEEVIMLEPYYDSYVALAQMAGAKRVPVTLRAPDFRLPIDELRAAVTPRTTAILLNTPHNPTGAVLELTELAAVAELAIEHDLVVITDEVYEHLSFDVAHVPIATLPGMAERTLTISSGAKTFSFTGWKIGWASGPEALVSSVLQAKQFMTYTSGAPLQPAIADALELGDGFYSALTQELRSRRDQLCSGLSAIGFETFVPEGTFFATTDVAPLGYRDGLQFCLMLPQSAGVVAVPHQVFYDDPEPGRTLVRWAFCKRPEVIDEALDRLQVLASGGSR